jgi:hypothetical protein
LPKCSPDSEARERRLRLGQRPYRIEDRLPRRPLEHSQQLLEIPRAAELRAIERLLPEVERPHLERHLRPTRAAEDDDTAAAQSGVVA